MTTTNFDLSLELRTGGAAKRVDRLTRSSKRAGTSLDRTARASTRLGRSTRVVGTSSTRTDRSVRRLTSSTRRLGRSSTVASKALRSIRRRLLGVGVGLVAVIAGVQGLRTSIDVFAQFEQSMAAVQAVTSASTTEMVQMTSVARELGETTRFSASEAAQGMAFLGRAGFETSEIIGAITPTLNLAAAAQLELGRAADITSNIMSAFGVEASETTRIADALASASANANTDVSQMGEAMKLVGPVAAALGISMEDSAAAIGILSNAGLQASLAGTGLRRVLSELANPSKEASKSLAALGIQVEDLNPATHSLTEIVEALAGANIQAADAFTIFGDRGAPAILALTSQAGELRKLTSTVNESEGAALSMAGVMEDTLAGAGRELRSVIESVRIAFGEQLAPVLVTTADRLSSFLRDNREEFAQFGRSASGALSSLVEVLAFLGRNFDILTVALGAAAAGFVGLKLAGVVTALGSAAAALSTTSGALLVMDIGLTKAAAGWARLNVAMLANPAGAIAVAFAALAGLLLLSVNHVRQVAAEQERYNDTVRFGTEEINSSIKSHRELTGLLDMSRVAESALITELKLHAEQTAEITRLEERRAEVLADFQRLQGQSSGQFNINLGRAQAELGALDSKLGTVRDALSETESSIESFEEAARFDEFQKTIEQAGKAFVASMKDIEKSQEQQLKATEGQLKKFAELEREITSQTELQNELAKAYLEGEEASEAVLRQIEIENRVRSKAADLTETQTDAVRGWVEQQIDAEAAAEAAAEAIENQALSMALLEENLDKVTAANERRVSAAGNDILEDFRDRQRVLDSYEAENAALEVQAKVLEEASLFQRLFGDATREASIQLELQRQLMQLGGKATKEYAAELEAAIRKNFELNEAADSAQNLADTWFSVADSIATAVSSIDSSLGQMISSATQAAAALRQVSQLSDSASAGDKFNAGFAAGGAFGQFGLDAGLAKGQRGTGRFGGQLSGDFAKEGAQLGAAIGTVIFPVVGTIIGAALGFLVGSLVKSGADEALATLSSFEGEIQANITKAEGGLRGAIEDLTGGVVEVFREIESAFNLDGIELGDVSFKIRDDMISVFIDGFEARFQSMDDAIAFAVQSLSRSANFLGVEPFIQEALQQAAKVAATPEEFLRLANSLAELSGRGVSDAGRAVLNFANEISTLHDDLLDLLGSGSLENLQAGLKAFTEFAVEGFTELRNQILGIQESPAEKLAKDAALFNSTLFDFVDKVLDQADRLVTNTNDPNFGKPGFAGSGGNPGGAGVNRPTGTDLNGELINDIFDAFGDIIGPGNFFNGQLGNGEGGIFGDITEFVGGLISKASNAVTEGVFASLDAAQQNSEIAAVLASNAVRSGVITVAQALTDAGISAKDIIDAETQAAVLQLLDLQITPEDLAKAEQAQNKGNGSRREARARFRDIAADAKLLLDGVSQGVVDFGARLRELEADLEAARKAGIKGGELSAAQRDQLDLLSKDFVAPIEEFLKQLNESDFQTGARQIQDRFADAFDQAMLLAEARAKVFGTSVADEFATLSALIEEGLAAEIGEFLTSEIDRLVNAGDVQGLSDLADQAEALGFSQEQLNDIYEAQGTAVENLIESVRQSLQSYLDLAQGIGASERALIDVQGEFAAAREALDAAGLSGLDLIQVLLELELAEQAAVQALGVDFVNSLTSLGISLPTDLVLEMAQAQFELAKAQAVAGAIALEAAGAFAGLSISFADVLDIIDGANFDRSTFNPNRVTFSPQTVATQRKQVDEANTAALVLQERIANQIIAWSRLPFGAVTKQAFELKDSFDELIAAAADAEVEIDGLERAFDTAVGDLIDRTLKPFEDLQLSPLERELRDLISNFEDMRLAFDQLGASSEDMARLADAQQAAIDDFWERATAPLRGLLDELKRNDPRVSSSDNFTNSLDDFRNLAARARAGDLDALEQLEAAGRRLLAQSDSFLGQGVGGNAVRDELLATLEELTSGLDPALFDPVVQEVAKGNARLLELIAEIEIAAAAAAAAASARAQSDRERLDAQNRTTTVNQGGTTQIVRELEEIEEQNEVIIAAKHRELDEAATRGTDLRAAIRTLETEISAEGRRRTIDAQTDRDERRVAEVLERRQRQELVDGSDTQTDLQTELVILERRRVALGGTSAGGFGS